MKKLLLCVAALAFLVGCGKSDIEKINDDLSKQTGACADVAFKDTKAKLEEANQLNAAGKTTEANAAVADAKELYNAGVLRLNDMQSSVEKLASDIDAQKSRLAAVETDANRVSSKEYTAAKKRVDALHNDASAKIANCNAVAAETAVKAAEREVLAVEAMVGKAAPAHLTDATYVVKKGDCLWSIAKDQYADPYFWPLIYWANKADIKDPDLIYPNQKFIIDSTADINTKTQAEKFARTRGAWSLYDNQ